MATLRPLDVDLVLITTTALWGCAPPEINVITLTIFFNATTRPVGVAGMLHLGVTPSSAPSNILPIGHKVSRRGVASVLHLTSCLLHPQACGAWLVMLHRRSILSR
jgi:hypothetical protein